MNEVFSRDDLLSNAAIVELEHVYSYSENHHQFYITIMCIKYKVTFMYGSIFDIDYHDDYINCFSPLKETSSVSPFINDKICRVINHYINENKWLQGWVNNWKDTYLKTWENKMIKESVDSSYKYIEPNDSLKYFILKNDYFVSI